MHRSLALLLGALAGLGTASASAQDHGSFRTLGDGLAGRNGVPALRGAGSLRPGSPVTLSVTGAAARAPGALILGRCQLRRPLAGGLALPSLDQVVEIVTGSNGAFQWNGTWPLGVPEGTRIYLQSWILDGPGKLAASTGLRIRTPPLTKGAAWRHGGFDERGTRRYPYPSVRNGGRLVTLWNVANVTGRSVRTADLNQDGVLDVALADGATLQTFDARRRRLLWKTSAPGLLTHVGDVDGDCRPELCLGVRIGRSLQVHVYDDDGRRNAVLDRGPWTSDSAVGVHTSFGEYVLTLYGAGYSTQPRGAGILRYGSKREDAYYPTGGGGHGASAVGDVDGNGVPDVAIGWFTPHNGARRNGTTDADLYGVVVEADIRTRPARFRTHFSTIITRWNRRTNPNGRLHAMMADLDRNGRDEIFFVEGHNRYYRGVNYAYLVDGTGSLRALTSLGRDVEWFTFAVVGDLNGNRADEIVVAENRGGGRLWVLDGRTLATIATAVLGNVQAVVDADGDGAEDLVTHDPATGTLALVSPKTLSVKNSSAVGAITGFAVSDVTGDGRREFVLVGARGLTVVGLR